MFHGAFLEDSYENKIVKKVQEKYPSKIVKKMYYSKFFQYLNDKPLNKIPNSSLLLNVMLTEGINYQYLIENLKPKVKFTKPILEDILDILDENTRYIAHGPDNVSYLKAKEKINIVYLDEIEEAQENDKLLFLTRNKHVKSIKNTEGKDILLDNEIIIDRLINKLEEIDDSKDRN